MRELPPWASRAAPPALGALAGGVVLALIIAIARCGKSPARPDASDGALAPGDRSVIAWCAEGLEPIPGGGCFAAPARGGPASLVVYLHGRYAPTPEGTAEELERQARVARLATARGWAVLAVRGRQGQCTAPEVRDYWCWPSNERVVDAGPEFVAGFSVALEEAEARLSDAGKGKRFLLGFSNGGYFAALIATRALLPFDAVAIAGAGPVEPTRAEGPMPPILLVTADSDPSVTSMMLLDDELARARWPHAIVTRDGGHALIDGDVSAALTFFARSAEPFPLSPPLSTRAPSPKLDAGEETPSADAAAAPPVGEGSVEAGESEGVP